MKRLYEISWQVDEPTYRKDPALSQSTLSKYEREGFSKLDTLFEHISTPSLTFGSLVDELITGDRDSFDKRFLVAEFPKLEALEETAVRALVAQYGETHKTMDSLSSSDIIPVLNSCGFYGRWGNDKRIAKITQPACKDFYRLSCCTTKQIVSQQDYDDATACAEALHGAAGTAVYFGADSENVKRYYQLKFKGTIDGVEYRGMLDLIIVDYAKKVIIPCDLKTTSSLEYEFYHSFLKWRYDLQARLYWRLLRMAMDADEYFKDFRLAPFRFICINRRTRKPLVWEFPNTEYDKEIELGYKTLRTPWEIGKELSTYLNTKPNVPNGIKEIGVNNLAAFLKYNESETESE